MQCASQWLLEEETHKFVPMSKKVSPFEIAVPACLWNFDSKYEHHVASGLEMSGGVLTSAHSVYRKTLDFVLNQVCITLTQGYKHAVIWYYDTLKKVRSKIELDANPNRVVRQNRTGRRYYFLEGIAYQIMHDGRETRVYSQFGPQSTQTKDFMWVPGLAHHDESGPGTKPFSYGLIPQQYDVIYKGHSLNGTSYALVCGPWAILLDDDLMFDTLALLKGIKSRTLDVEQFFYTTNVYIAKMITLLK